MNIIIALIVFELLVVFHEFGHFIAARACGVKVVEFSVGMGPKICSAKRKETMFSLRALPIGGSCSMVGEDDEDEADVEGSLASRPVWQRMLVLFAGPFFNFILAFLLAGFILSQAGVDHCVLTDVTPGFPAEEAGLQAGDEVIGLNRNKVVFFRDLQTWLYFHKDEPVDVKVRRTEGEAPKELTFHLTPKYDTEQDRYMIGIICSGRRDPVEGAGQLLYYSLQEVRFNVTSVITGLSMMIRGKISPDNITGPVGIVESIGETVEETKEYGFFTVLLNLMNVGLLLSANLGVMNLLPLPALDGGRLLFCFVELIFRRPVNRSLEGAVHFAGFVLLMALMAVIMMHDIGRIFF
ncbi:MAG: site-2 protease family protein [Stomatobaculum sp.]|nr:site-2 protease family protein [Stomatobaculum sp.]